MTPNNIVTRRPLTSEAPEVVAFFRCMMATVFSNTFPSEAIKHYCHLFDEASIQQDCKDASKALLIAVLDGKIVGLVTGGRANGGVASIVWLMIDPSAQGLGLGRALMSKVFHHYGKLGAHKCIVYTETITAKNFYLNIGMTLEGEHPNHWWGKHHYCLSKLLA